MLEFGYSNLQIPFVLTKYFAYFRYLIQKTIFMITRKRFITMLMLLILCLSSIAQKRKEIEIKGAKGTAYSDCISQSETIAIQQAKREALNRAGIAENIQVQNAFEKVEIDGDYSELFSSNIFSQTNGTVSNIKIVEKTQRITNGMVVTNVIINCTVLKYETKADPMFQININNIQSFYTSGSKLTFNVTPTKDCYMKAWLFTGTEAFPLFPNTLEESYLLQANNTSNFPSYKANYTLNLNGDEQQIHRLIIVFMKKDYPYTGNVNYKEISEWIFGLPLDQRVVKYSSFTVTK